MKVSGMGGPTRRAFGLCCVLGLGLAGGNPNHFLEVHRERGRESERAYCTELVAVANQAGPGEVGLPKGSLVGRIGF